MHFIPLMAVTAWHRTQKLLTYHLVVTINIFNFNDIILYNHPGKPYMGQTTWAVTNGQHSGRFFYSSLFTIYWRHVKAVWCFPGWAICYWYMFGSIYVNYLKPSTCTSLGRNTVLPIQSTFMVASSTTLYWHIKIVSSCTSTFQDIPQTAQTLIKL